MDNKRNSLIENLKSPGKGVPPLVDIIKDLEYKKEYTINSWFAIGHFETEGQKLNYLFHLMIMQLPGQPTVLNSCISITNETTGWYSGEDIIIPLELCEVSDNEFNIKAPNGFMTGNYEKMTISATMPSGGISATLLAEGYPLFNGGTGRIPLLGMDVHQYSLPTLKTTGTITIEGKEYAIEGDTWFDRQWQIQDKDITTANWSWMDINLDNGEKISLWDSLDREAGDERAWATIMQTDGTLTLTSVKNFSEGASDFWKSPKTGNTYPTHWVIEIADFDAVLEVSPSPREQEIASMIPFLNKYEGASFVKGTYKGKEVSGYCYVELVGNWS